MPKSLKVPEAEQFYKKLHEVDYIPVGNLSIRGVVYNPMYVFIPKEKPFDSLNNILKISNGSLDSKTLDILKETIRTELVR